ncbi:hypothetical protein HXX76_014905 [Chlamydomonas incerta]|uniref:Translation initiation factor 3 C-terminal domain-containing protein n=1 Tax=Chlamydomonas incerta TaxID=51695 RepID=A0A835SQ49_CHLIN|nr:hypothetical protein HXX76_014905 [Chlamydomonas incerta]|eukprot:KAG2423966.1 hypothetical protein HXX76_014905 [Chlamydomonas incerta]
MALQLLLCQLSRQGRSPSTAPLLALGGCAANILPGYSTRTLSTSLAAASSCAEGEARPCAGTPDSGHNGPRPVAPPAHGRTSSSKLQAAPVYANAGAGAIAAAPRASGSFQPGWHRAGGRVTAPSPSGRAASATIAVSLPAARPSLPDLLLRPAAPAGIYTACPGAPPHDAWAPWAAAPHGVRRMSREGAPRDRAGGGPAPRPSTPGAAPSPGPRQRPPPQTQQQQLLPQKKQQQPQSGPPQQAGDAPQAGSRPAQNRRPPQDPQQQPQAQPAQQGQQGQQQRPRQGAKAPQPPAPPSKELQLRPRISEHDLATKLRRAEGWLEDGLRVQLVVEFKGGDEEGGRAAAALVDSVAGRLAAKGQAMGSKRQMKNSWLLTLKPAAPPKPAKQPAQAAQQQPAAPDAAAPVAAAAAAAAAATAPAGEGAPAA